LSPRTYRDTVRRVRTDAYPLLLTPVYKDYVWGGRRIAEVFGRDTGGGACAESWEVADRPEGMSRVRNGSLEGVSLHDLMVRFGEGLLGTEGAGGERGTFPLLIKIIDAARRLSVQVHPGEETAPELGGEPKTEMWIVLQADPGACVYAGFRPGTTPDTLNTVLNTGQFEDILRPVPLRPGDALFIPAGRVHAIGGGCLLLEIQQNSNTTYRLYDWGRVGSDGKPRPLHVPQALRAIDWSDEANPIVSPKRVPASGRNNRWDVLRCPYFHVTRTDLHESEDVKHDGRSFHVLFTAEGSAAVEGGGVRADTPAGTTCLVPAALPAYRLTPEADGTSVICVSRV
jgi:mannose-6-phosphate isomerase